MRNRAACLRYCKAFNELLLHDEHKDELSDARLGFTYTDVLSTVASVPIAEYDEPTGRSVHCCGENQIRNKNNKNKLNSATIHTNTTPWTGQTSEEQLNQFYRQELSN